VRVKPKKPLIGRGNLKADRNYLEGKRLEDDEEERCFT